MTSAQFKDFLLSLSQALARDGIQQCDIRLQGSSAHFYSGSHKKMPWDRGQVSILFRSTRKRVPENPELDEIEKRRDRVWPSSEQRPIRRPFDSMYHVGIDRYPSDYDVQISSDQIRDMASDLLESLGIAVTEEMLFSQDYDFIMKDLVDEICPILTRWAAIASDKLQRGVSIAVFPSCGPPIKDGVVSAHFRETDWKVSI